MAIRTIPHLGLCSRPRLLLEFLCERHVVEESPRVVELGIPCPLQIVHAPQKIIYFLIPHQAQYGGVYAGTVRVVGLVVVTLDSAEGFWGFSGN